MAAPSSINGLALCSGIGGICRGLADALPGYRTVCHVEIEAACAATLVARMEAGDMDQAPVWSDLRTFDPEPWRKGNLEDRVAAWPTPNASQANYDEDPETWEARRKTLEAKGTNGNGAGLPLGQAAQRWATPRSSDGEKGSPNSRDSSGSLHLNNQANRWATPTVQDAANNAGPLRWDRNSKPLNVEAVEFHGRQVLTMPTLGPDTAPITPEPSRQSAASSTLDLWKP